MRLHLTDQHTGALDPLEDLGEVADTFTLVGVPPGGSRIRIATRKAAAAGVVRVRGPEPVSPVLTYTAPSRD